MRMNKLILLSLMIFSLVYSDDDDEIVDVDLSYIDSSLIDIVWCGVDKDSDDNVYLI